jgi:hypothetical protein
LFTSKETLLTAASPPKNIETPLTSRSAIRISS